MRSKHKGLRALAGQDRARQLPGDLVPKLRRVLTLLYEAQHPATSRNPVIPATDKNDSLDQYVVP